MSVSRTVAKLLAALGFVCVVAACSPAPTPTPVTDSETSQSSISFQPTVVHAFDRFCYISEVSTTDNTLVVHGQVISDYVLPDSIKAEEYKVYYVSYTLGLDGVRTITAVADAPADQILQGIDTCPRPNNPAPTSDGS